MAVDISTDLIILANGQILSTPTVNGIYDSGGAPGQYDPGKDYSATDNISKGEVVTYSINISLNSRTNQDYPLDRLTIGGADRAGNLSYVNIYRLNDDPDALITADTGVNTLVPNTNAVLVPIIVNSDIESNSTLSTQVSIQLPPNAFWKTKLEPQILVLAEKDGKQASYTFGLPPISLAPKADYTSIISTNNSFATDVTYTNGAIHLPFQVLSNIRTIDNIIRLADNPDFASVTYGVDLSATVNGTTELSLATEDFTFTSPPGFSVTFSNYNGATLSFTLTGPYKSISSQEYATKITANVPYTPALGETNATIRLLGSWEANNAVTIEANNNYQILYDLLNIGFINGNAPFVDLTGGGIGALRLRQVISNQGLHSNSISQYVDATHDDLFYQAPNSQYVLLVDSQITGIGPVIHPSISLQFTDLNGTGQTAVVPAAAYSQTFAYAPTTAPGYDPNSTIQEILLGIISSGSYQDIIDGGHLPTARIITLLTDPWAGTDFDPMKSHRIVFNDAQFVPIQPSEFLQLYNDNPTEDFTTYLHSYTSLNTTLSSVEEGNLLYGHLMASMDEFQERNGSIYLNLGTTAKTESLTTTQFNDVSTVQNEIPVPVWFSEFENGIVFASGSPAAIISDYTRPYYLILRRKAQPVNYWNTQPIILEGTPVEFDIPTNLSPYFMIADTPYIRDRYGVQTPIYNYQYNGTSIKFEMPLTVIFDFGGSGIYFPISFIVPNQNIPVQFVPPVIPPEDIVANLPGSALDHFPSGTPYYQVQYFPLPSNLVGVEVDNTGLLVTPHIYPSGTSVKYTAIINNINFDFSDYYTFNTVPTNEYNEIETSNNSQKAYINSIVTFSTSTEVYYQTADKVTPQDIQMSKLLQGPVNLMTYYDQTIKLTWTKWHMGDTLPDNVVMLSSFTPDVAKGDFVRIDYDVTVQMETDTTVLYCNDASFKYYSTGSSLEAHSNIVQIQNIPQPSYIPVKSVNPEQIDLGGDRHAVFTITYPLPPQVNTSPNTTLEFSDPVDSRLEIISSTTNLSDNSSYYSVTHTLVNNQLIYKVETHIPQGETGDLPDSVIITMQVNYQPNGCCPQTIPNTAYFQMNELPRVPTDTIFLSVNFQNLTDLWESVALMEAALSHIINAEGEKLQAIINDPSASADLLLAANASVNRMIDSIARLELLLNRELELFECSNSTDI